MPKQTRRWKVAALARGLEERELVDLGIRALAAVVPAPVSLSPREELAAHQYVDMGLGEYDVRWAIRHGDVLFTRARQCTSDACGPSHMRTNDKVVQAGVVDSPIELATSQSAIATNYWLDLEVTVEGPSDEHVAHAMDAVDAGLAVLVAAEHDVQRRAAQRPVIVRRRTRLLLPDDCRAPSPELPLRLLFIGRNRRGDQRPIEDRYPVDVTPGVAGLDDVSAHAARAGGVVVQMLDATLEELRADFEDSPEISKSGLHRLMVGGTFGGRQGSPYAAVLVEGDIVEAQRKVFDELRAVAAAAHAIVVFTTADELYDSLSWQILRSLDSARWLMRAGRSIERTAIDLIEAFATYGFCADTSVVDHFVAGRFVVERVAQVLKRLRRHRIRTLRDAPAVEADLGAWLAEQCSEQDDGTRPFQDARLRVFDDGPAGSPFYRFELLVTPHNEPGAPARTWGTSGTMDVE